MQNKKFIIIVIAIVAVGIAIIVGVRTLTGSGKYDPSEGQMAIQRAVQQGQAASSIPPPSGVTPKGVVTKLPGNKGRN